jgi:secondary thiamine-phosphate synthase enzyme
MNTLYPSSKITPRIITSGSRHSILLSDVIFKVRSEEPIEFIDLTDQINRHLLEHGIRNGTATVFSRHTTAAIKINEAEELLLEDFKQMLRRLCPVEHDYHHNDMSRRKPPIAPDERPNAHSHCMHLLLSTSETIPVVESRLALGTWQRIFMVELDGPREREVHLRCHSYVSSGFELEIPANGNGNGHGSRSSGSTEPYSNSAK